MCASFIQFFIGWLSRRLTHMVCKYASSFLIIQLFDIVVWITMNNIPMCHSVYLSPIWFRSFLFKYYIRWLQYFFCLLHSVCLLKLLWFHKTTTHKHTMKIANICVLRLALQMGIICKPALCVCAHTKQRKCSNYNCCKKNMQDRNIKHDSMQMQR